METPDGTKGHGDDRGIRARWTEIRGAQRRSAVLVLAGHIVRDQLRDPGGSGPFLGEAFRRRKRSAMPAGCKTNMACPGKSFPAFSSSCYKTKNSEKTQSVVKAMMKMVKLDIKRLAAGVPIAIAGARITGLAKQVSLRNRRRLHR